MKVRRLQVGGLATNCYVVWDEGSPQSAQRNAEEQHQPPSHQVGTGAAEGDAGGAEDARRDQGSTPRTSASSASSAVNSGGLRPCLVIDPGAEARTARKDAALEQMVREMQGAEPGAAVEPAVEPGVPAEEAAAVEPEVPDAFGEGAAVLVRKDAAQKKEHRGRITRRIDEQTVEVDIRGEEGVRILPVDQVRTPPSVEKRRQYQADLAALPEAGRKVAREESKAFDDMLRAAPQFMPLEFLE